MIDYHCHLLPGLDDGPQTAEESLDMARALAAFGFREICCTPHCIKGHYEFSPVEVRESVRRLQARIDFEGIALTLRPGMEYHLDEYFEQYAANLLPLGESCLVLCEAPPQALPGLVANMASLIVVQGFVPLIAHPERSDVIWEMLENPGLGTGSLGSRQDRGENEPVPTRTAEPFWRRLFSSRLASSPQPPVPSPRLSAPASHELPETCLFQANLGAFTGYYGPKPQRRAYELLQRGVYGCLASDLHEARSADFLELAQEKLAFNPALRKLGAFVAPYGQGERSAGVLVGMQAKVISEKQHRMDADERRFTLRKPFAFDLT